MIAAKNIKFEYADNVAPNVNKEQSMINSVNMWFGPYVDKINEQNGTINIFFDKKEDSHISFDNMDEGLEAILYKQAELFRPSRNH